MDHRLAREDARGDAAWDGRGGIMASELGKIIRRSTERNSPQPPALSGVKLAEFRPAKEHGPFQHRVEHRREIAWRGIDDLQFLCHCRLLGECLVAFGIARGK